MILIKENLIKIKAKNVKDNKAEAGVSIIEGAAFTAAVYKSLIGACGFGVPITIGAGCWLINKALFNANEEDNENV